MTRARLDTAPTSSRRRSPRRFRVTAFACRHAIPDRTRDRVGVSLWRGAQALATLWERPAVTGALHRYFESCRPRDAARAAGTSFPCTLVPIAAAATTSVAYELPESASVSQASSSTRRTSCRNLSCAHSTSRVSSRSSRQRGGVSGELLRGCSNAVSRRL